MNTLNYILRADLASIFFPGEPPVTVNAEHPKFSPIVEILQDRETSVEEKIAALRSLVSLKDIIPADDRFTIQSGMVFYLGQRVPDGVSKQFLKVSREGGNVDAVTKFIVRMFENPDSSSVEQLYEFIEANDMMITEDGFFLGYKAVRPDFLDIHSATIYNFPGSVVSMSRKFVNSDRNTTCSTGLHIAALDYARSFSDGESPIVICKIDPKDVVSVPYDYNNQKMRVCHYEVIGVYQDNGERAPIFEHTAITEEDLQTDKLIGNTTKVGQQIEWAANGKMLSGTIHGLVMAGVSAHALVKHADPEHGRLRFKDKEDFNRVLIRSERGWNSLPLSRIEKKMDDDKTKPAQDDREEINQIRKGDLVSWTSVVGGKALEFEGTVVRRIPAGKSGLDPKKTPMSAVASGKLFRYQVRFDQDINPKSDRLLVAVEREDGQVWYYAPLYNKVSAAF